MPKVERCGVCRCSEFEPCEPPCFWIAPGICSSCFDLACKIREWHDDVARKPSFLALIGLVKELRGKVGPPLKRLAAVVKKPRPLRLKPGTPRHG